jgi:hypothetical protein
MTTILSYLLLGFVSKELLTIGVIESFLISLIVGGLVISFVLKIKNIEEEKKQLSSDINSIKKIEEEKEILISELKQALEEVSKLSGLLPICSSCKNIRDDKGYWNQIESYIKDHSDAEFSHSICPDCSQKLYGNFVKNKQDTDKFSYDINTESNLIHVYCKGFFTIDDIKSGAEQLYADPLFKKGMNSIVALTEARIDLNYERVRELMVFMKSKEEIRGKCKIGVLVSSDLIYGIIRMLGFLSEHTLSSIRPFKSHDEAYKWVTNGNGGHDIPS